STRSSAAASALGPGARDSTPATGVTLSMAAPGHETGVASAPQAAGGKQRPSSPPTHPSRRQPVATRAAAHIPRTKARRVPGAILTARRARREVKACQVLTEALSPTGGLAVIVCGLAGALAVAGLAAAGTLDGGAPPPGPERGGAPDGGALDGGGA